MLLEAILKLNVPDENCTSTSIEVFLKLEHAFLLEHVNSLDSGPCPSTTCSDSRWCKEDSAKQTCRGLVERCVSLSARQDDQGDTKNEDRDT